MYETVQSCRPRKVLKSLTRVGLLIARPLRVCVKILSLSLSAFRPAMVHINAIRTGLILCRFQHIHTQTRPCQYEIPRIKLSALNSVLLCISLFLSFLSSCALCRRSRMHVALLFLSVCSPIECTFALSLHILPHCNERKWLRQMNSLAEADNSVFVRTEQERLSLQRARESAGRRTSAV